MGHALKPFLPLPVMPRGMQNGGYSHDVIRLVHFVYDAVREMIGIAPANVQRGMSSTLEQGILRQSIPNTDDLLNELCSQSRLASFVPLPGGQHVASISGAKSRRQVICRGADEDGILFHPKTKQIPGFLAEPQGANLPAFHPSEPAVDHPTPKRAGQPIAVAQRQEQVVPEELH